MSALDHQPQPDKNPWAPPAGSVKDAQTSLATAGTGIERDEKLTMKDGNKQTITDDKTSLAYADKGVAYGKATSKETAYSDRVKRKTTSAKGVDVVVALAVLIHVAGCSSSDSPGAQGGPDAPVVPDAAVAPDAPVPGGDAPGATVEHVYVGTFLGGLHTLDVDPTQGDLAERANSAIAGSFESMAIDPSHTFLYAVDFDHAKLFSYRIGADASLVPLSTSAIDTSPHPVTIATDPLGRFVYVGVDGGIAVYRIDADSGVLTAVNHSPFDAGGAVSFLAAEPSGRFVYASQPAPAPIAAFRVDAQSGALVQIDGSPFMLPEPGLPGAIVFDVSGKHLYYGPRKLYGFTIDGDTGGLKLIDGAPFPGAVGSDAQAMTVAVDPLGRYLYTVSNAGTTVAAYHIHADTGVLSPVDHSPFAAGTMPYSVAVDPDGRFVYVGNDDADQVTVLSIDPASGELKKTDHGPFTVHGLEPEMIVLKLRP